MEQSLDINQIRNQLTGLFTVRPAVYWADFLFHISVGYVALLLVFGGYVSWPVGTALVLLASACLYRTALFIHEIAHARYSLPAFTVVWNILAGIPLAMPSFIYYQSHLLHHKQQTYGTTKDGEYIPFGALPRIAIFKYLLLSFFGPVLMIGRFAVLTLPSFIIPPLRRWIVQHASSLVIETEFLGEEPQGRDKAHWLWQEPLAAIYWITVITLASLDIIPQDKFLWFLLLMCSVHVVNAIRTLAAHRWLNKSLKPMNFDSQYLDSVNLVGGGLHAVVNSLVAPVGLRYHALHHLFQGLPYHSLGEAHRKLAKTLPGDSLYFKANEVSLFKTLSDIWQASGQATSAKYAQQ